MAVCLNDCFVNVEAKILNIFLRFWRLLIIKAFLKFSLLRLRSCLKRTHNCPKEVTQILTNFLIEFLELLTNPVFSTSVESTNPKWIPSVRTSVRTSGTLYLGKFSTDFLDILHTTLLWSCRLHAMVHFWKVSFWSLKWGGETVEKGSESQSCLIEIKFVNCILFWGREFKNEVHFWIFWISDP